MKTDISRNTFRPDKYYSSVRRQQGRVDLDADWNEQADIFHQDARLRFVDSMGPIGAPSNDPGFQIAPSGDSLDLTVSSGRFYIDGVLVRNESEFNVSTQPDLPGVAMPSADGNYLAYLKVHERAVTALEDPSIRETALGGPDTTTRMKVIRQIQFASVSESDIDSRTVPAVWSTIISRNPGRMSARTEADGGTDPCAVGARGGYTGLDNLLYRVEIHDGGQAGTATYKWSRDNGSLVTEWLEQEGDTLTLRSTGNDNVLNFAPGQWVELTDEGMELEGIAGTLAQILRVEGRRITINPDNIQHFAGSAGTLDINEFSRGVRKVRRWDNTELVAPPIVPDGAGGEVWITLESGIEVRFDDLASTREYRTGDYWMIPARADNNNIEWPCDNNGNIEHDPHGTYFYYARLAFVNLTGGNWSVIADARAIFPGLTDEELVYVGGDGQLSVPGQILDRPLEVRVTRGATPVADAKVRFTVTSGTGTIEDSPGGTSGTTLDIKADSEGIARVYWTLLDSVAGQSVRAVLLDESDTETALYVVFGAGSGVASGIQYTPISTDSSVAGTTNVQEALDALADNKVNRSGDTMTGNLTVNADLEVTGNMTIRGDVIARDAQQQAGDVLLGDDDIDRVIIHGTLQSNHTSGSLEIEAPVHMRTTDPTKSPLRVDGPSTGGSPRLYRLPLDLDNTAGGAATLTDYQLPVTVDTAAPIAAGRMEGDGADILFEDQDGTNLPYWIESGINTATTLIWVRIPLLTSGTNRTIYMMYGNDSAVSQSSAAATFVREIPGHLLAYNFDEGSGTTTIDYSGNGYDGTITGATYTTGQFGQALDFDGTTNLVQAPVTWPTIGAGDFSISLWYRPELIAGDSRVLLSDETFTNFMLNVNPNGELVMHIGTASTASPIYPWTLNAWHHVVAVRSAGQVTLYVNGVPVDSTANATSALASTLIDIGYRTSDNMHPVDGQIDEVRVLNRAMSIGEITDQFNNAGYLTLNNSGSELIRRTPVQEPTITAQAEEANPLSETPILFAQESSGNVGIGTDAPGEKLTVDGVIETKTGGIKFPDGTIQTTAGGPGGGGGEPLPIGTIMAWHRDFAGSPAIPDGWVECNGQILNDSESPYDGLVIPNLNGQKESWNSKGSFLRGGATSGEFEDDAIQSHRHNLLSDNREGRVLNPTISGGEGTGSGTINSSPYITTGLPSGDARVASETRPVNMSVVWIMKIKETGEAGLWTPNSEGIHFNAGKVSVGTDVTDEQLTVTGAISIEEKVLEPDTTDDFGKIYVRENDLSHLTLNGVDQYVSMPSLGRPAVGDHTIAIWFRIEDNTLPQTDDIWVFDTREQNVEGPDVEVIVEAKGGGEYDVAYSYGWPSGGGSSQKRISLGPALGVWNHFAVQREDSTVRAYLNGRHVSSNFETGPAAKSDPMPWNVPWKIAQRSNLSNPGWSSFPGSLDDMGLWERALSADEITALYNSGRGSDVPTAFASSLLAFYPMSQSATPGQLDDVSGNDFHGTIQNGATIIPERVGSLYFKDGFGNVTSLAGGGDSYRTGGSGNQVPLGTIMAWHKDHPGHTPIIPDGWVECNGQTLDDPASPYHNQLIPDLNGDGRFLRGSDTSGDFQADELRSHSHQQQTGLFGSNIGDGIRAYTHNGQFPSTLSTIATGGSETRPINMSVVWIMKVRETDRDRGLWRESGEDIYFDDGRVGVGAKTANTKLHVSSNDLEEAPLRVDARVTLQGVQGRLYRAPINLENTDTNDLIDQQIPLTIDTATLVSTGKMRFDGGDMLFVDSDGKTLLPHFIERDMNSASTKVWVRVPNIAAGETRRIFMQYGKQDATDLASPEATFLRIVPNTVVAWNFDESSGNKALDASETGYDGNVAAARTTGYRGDGISVTSNAGVDGLIAKNWGFTTSGTISAWVKPDPGTGGTIATLQHGNVNDEFILFGGDGQAAITNHNTGGQFSQRSSISPTPADQWTHVVGVMEGPVDASQFRVYINGVREEGAITINNNPFPISDSTPRRFHAGVRPNRPAEFFRGEIDVVRLYQRALTDQEVADLYANDSTFSPSLLGQELVHRPLPLPPTITVAAEEPNPVSGSPVLFAQNLTGNIGLGTDEPQAKLHIAGEAGVDGIMFPDGTVQTTAGGPGGGGDSTPLGTIIAWHKSLSGTPAIPQGWVECNGQVLTDSDSPFDGQVIPNLNGDERFLRGGNISGDLQDDAMQGHFHTITRDGGETNQMFWTNEDGGDGGLVSRGSFSTGVPFSVGSARSDGTNGNPRTADETRPVNMSVVWIMKVKQVTGQSGLWSIGPNGIRYDQGKVSVGTAVADEQLTVAGAISLEEKVLEPDTTDDFGKIYVRENDLSYLSLNGVDQYASMPNMNRPALGDHTFAIWFRLDETLYQAGDSIWFLDSRQDTTEGPGTELILQAQANNTYNLYYSTNWPTGGTGAQAFVALGNIAGEWHHVAYSREGSVLRLYLDGRLVSAEPTNGAAPKNDPFNWTVPWRIGRRAQDANPNWFPFSGSLDDCGVWERALSPDEIAALHNGGRGSDVPTAYASSLVAFYPMSQSATPGQLDDISGNDLHGTIQNGAGITPERVGSLYFKDGFGNVTALAGGGDSYRTGGSGNQVPVGTIMAWHKSFTNTPAIPDGWVECNGQTLDDPASVYNGQVIPNLNGDPAGDDSPDVGDKKSMFLRGSLTSGDGQDDAFQGHVHHVHPSAGTSQGEFPTTHDGAVAGDTVNRVTWGTTSSPIAPGTLPYGDPRFGSETRPVNMSVVWIMKVRETDRDRGLWRENGEDIYFDDGLVGVGAKTATAKVHISAEDGFDTPLRIDGQTTLQGVQGRTLRQAIDLENTDTVGLADHQILLSIDTDALVSAGKMRFDGGDILFVDFDGKTILPHFIESGMNTTTTRIWVRVPAIPAGETRRIFMQYGRPDANSIASAESTFIQTMDDLVVAYNYEEGSGASVADASGNGIPLTFSASWTTGYRGNGGAYNGSQSSNVLGRNWGFGSNASFSAWIKTTSTAIQTIFSLHRDSLDDELLIQTEVGNITVTNHNSTSSFAKRSGLSQVNTGDWVHIVGTWNGGANPDQIRVYVNGVREDGGFTTVGSPGPVSDAATRALHIGYRGNGGLFFTGDIDQVRLFSRALSDQEVADIHAHESLVVPNHQSREFIHKAAPVALSETFNAEEPNPVSGSPILFAQNLTGNIGVGTDDPLGKLHVAGTAGVDGIVFPDGSLQTTAAKAGGGDSTPIGTIIAWHKSLGGTPAIPDGWVECNGQTLDDIDSPYHGQAIPDLNNPKESWNSKGSFLRGDTTSGVFEDDAFQGHRHGINIPFNIFTERDTTLSINPGPNVTSEPLSITDPISDGVNGTPRTDSETRPANMSVVWIMKIKQVGDIAWEPAPGGIAYAGGDVAIGQTAPNSKLTIDGALSLREGLSTPNATSGFGKLFTRSADLSYLELDGNDDYVSMPALGNANVGDFTVSTWFRLRMPNPVGAPNGYFLDIRGDGGFSSGGPVFVLQHLGNGEMRINSGVGYADTQTTSFEDNIGNITGEWHHAVFSREGAVFRHYLDGRLISDTPTGGASPRSEALNFNDGWRIGTDSSATAGNGDFWNGSLDDLAVWDRTLSEDDIAAIYNAGRGTDLAGQYAANMLGFWPMDDGAGATTIRDASGNGFDGTLQNGATIVEDQAGALLFQDGFGNTTTLAGSGGSFGSAGTGREVPIGTIMAWHKDLTGTPSMPPGWVECNGQTLSDSESPYDGQTIPNLNGDPAGADSPDLTDKKSMFLRGGLNSGAGQEDAFQGHIHNVYSHAGTQSGEFPLTVNGATGGDTTNLAANAVTSNAANPPGVTSYGNPRTDDETRPVNMTVVWIMKIKHTGNGAWEPVSGGLAFTGNRIGIGTTTPGFELDVNGTIQCVNLIQTSDARKKTDVETLGGALDLVEKLRGVRFKWHPDAVSKTMPAGIGQMGLIAQEVEAIMPEVVSTGQDGYKAIEYGKIVAVLIEAVKELKDKL